MWLCDIHVLFCLKMRRNVMFMNWFVFVHIHSILKFITSICLCLKVFVPACMNRYWYVVIANMRENRFEVICPFNDFNIVKEDALVIFYNFYKVFKCSYSVWRRLWCFTGWVLLLVVCPIQLANLLLLTYSPLFWKILIIC